jgi:glutamate dehydrogenase (NAD(P)+)
VTAAVLERPDAPPHRVIELSDPSVGMEAFVVIDHDLFPVSAGGTRMVSDVTVDEVARLARAMTWKFGAARVPYAGAKAGLRFGGGDREAVLASYLEQVGELRDFFLTGPDMGTDPEDFLPLEPPDGPTPMWARTYEGMGMDDLAVGWGIRGAARVVLERLGRPLEGASFAIEGFGKVGAGTARACARAGGRVVAVSTVEGAVVDPDGIEVDRLIALRDGHGDALVREAGLEPQPRETLFSVECDVLVPGARPDVIRPDNIDSLRARAIVPTANIPYASGAVEALHERGILALPDFVTNAGGVHLYEAPGCKGDDPSACLAAVEALIGETTDRVLEASARDGVTPTDAALAIAREFLLAAAR